ADDGLVAIERYQSAEREALAMVKALMEGAGLAPIAVVGLVVFVAVFLGITAWALSRSRGAIATWSSLPLADGTEPVEARGRQMHAGPASLPVVATEENENKGSCGKCEDCTC
ncbi:MAG: hypothetical protein AAGF31_13660, partial [Planctomycetota bacterium]